MQKLTWTPPDSVMDELEDNVEYDAEDAVEKATPFLEGPMYSTNTSSRWIVDDVEDRATTVENTAEDAMRDALEHYKQVMLGAAFLSADLDGNLL